MWKEGGCHCGKVRFKVQSTFDSVLDCNCSICNKVGYLHLIVRKEDFELLRGQEDLTFYEFGQKKAKHLFCRHCGVKSFYVPRSHPDGYSVNLRCVDDVALDRVKVEKFDGQNWEEAARNLKS
jgi:hypothetical protein